MPSAGRTTEGWPGRRPAAPVALAAAVVLGVLVFVLPGGAAARSAAPSQESDSLEVFGFLRHEGEPVEGARVEVADEAGAVVGDDVSDDGGEWRVTVPGNGVYTATLDETTLSEGVDLAAGAENPLTVEIQGRSRPLNFSLGERTADTPSTLEHVLQNTLNGVKLGLIIAMGAVGLSLIFGTTGLINFAHGELLTFGAVVAWFLAERGMELGLVVAAIGAMLITGAVGGLLEVSLFRPLRRRKLGAFQFVAFTIGLSLLARHLILIWFGAGPLPYSDYRIQEEWEFGPFAITPRDATIMVLSALILAAIGLMLVRTRMGKAMRAVSDNVDLAESSGIDVSRVTLSVWVVGAALAALGGVFFGLVETVEWQMGFTLLLLLFAAVILGGLGTAYGAMVGGIVIGVITEVSTVWFEPEIKSVFALAALIAVLLLRPQGILGVKGRIG